MDIGIKCQKKPPVRLRCTSSCMQSTPKAIGVTCEVKPPVRLRSLSARTQPPRNRLRDAVSGIRPEDEPQGSIWSLTHAILLSSQHPPAMDNSSQWEDLIPTSLKHASMCFRPPHAIRINKLLAILGKMFASRRDILPGTTLGC